MRFQQLMKQSNTILKKKMYKSGKNWVVKSTLSIAGGLALFGVSQVNVVKAEVTNNQVTDVQGQDVQGQDVQGQDVQGQDVQGQDVQGQDVQGQDIQGQDIQAQDVQVQNQSNSGTEDKQGAVSQSTSQGDSSKLDNVPSGVVNEKEGINLQAETPATPVKSEDVSVEKTGIVEQPAPQKVGNNPDETQAPQDNQYSGKIGMAENAVTWKVENGTDLVISSGTMDNMTQGVSPWGSDEMTQYLKDNITQVDFSKDGILYAGESISGMFQDFSKLVTVNNVGYIDVSKTKDFSYLFSGCKDLMVSDYGLADNFSLSIGEYDNINLSHMFSGDTSLKKITFIGMRGAVQDVSSMFEGDTSLTCVNMRALKMSSSTIASYLFKGANNIKELDLNASTNLTNSGLNVGSRNKEDMDKGITGWLAYESFDNTIKEGTIKDTDGLIKAYKGTIGSKGADNSTIWYNYYPYVFGVVSTDTNGKELGTPLLEYIPIGIKPDVTAFREKLKKLRENGSIVLNDSESSSGSRIFGHVDGQKDHFTPITSNYLGQKDLYDFLNQVLSILTAYPMDSSVANRKTISYLVYPSKENPNSSTGSSSSTNREIEGIEEKIATYAEQPDVQLYDDNGSILTDRKLAPNSDWYTDESMQLNKDKYYRVATNQWARADDVYLYYPSASKVRVNAGTTATLVTDEGKIVTDRALQPLSNWYTDKYIYINDVKYYRVATNEFVSANQVAEY